MRGLHLNIPCTVSSDLLRFGRSRLFESCQELPQPFSLFKKSVSELRPMHTSVKTCCRELLKMQSWPFSKAS